MFQARCSIFLALFLSAPAFGAGNTSSFGKEQPVQPADFRLHLDDSETYTESWTHGVWINGGGDMGINFVVTNVGIGDHKGTFEASFNDAAGQGAKCKVELDEGDWKSAPDRWQLTFGQNQLVGDAAGIKIQARCPELAFELRFENLAPPVKPGSGRLAFEKDDEEEGFLQMVFTSPRSKVTGWVEAGGRRQTIEGLGLGDHMWTNVGPHVQAKRWFKFNVVRDDLSIILAELESPGDLGGLRRGWALVYDQSGRLLATPRLGLEFDGWIADKNSSEGYSIPRRVRLAAVDGSNTLSGTMVMTAIKKIVDPLDNLNPVIRLVLKRWMKPRDYFLDCTYDLKLKVGSVEKNIEGSRFYRYYHINP